MKTTLEIPDRVFRRAKAYAASRGISFRQLVTEAVEQRLRSSQRPDGEPAWKRLSGRLAALRNETARLDRRIEQEFEQIDTEDVA